MQIGVVDVGQLGIRCGSSDPGEEHRVGDPVDDVGFWALQQFAEAIGHGLEFGLTNYQLIDGRVSVEHDGQLSVPHHHFDQTAYRHCPLLTRVGKRLGDLDETGDVPNRRAEDLEDDVFLGAKLVVHGSFADPDPVGDHLQRCAVHSVLGE